MTLERALNALDGEPVSLEAELRALEGRQRCPGPARASAAAGVRCPAAPRAPARARRPARTDPVLRELIDAVGRLRDAREGRPERDDHYGALVRSIIGQQVSVHAARAIYGRLTDRFGGRPPAPAEIVAEDPEELRVAAGLSRAKASYLRSLGGARHLGRARARAP